MTDYNIPGLSPQQWPTETGDQSQIRAFYGEPCDPSAFTTITIPWQCSQQRVQVHRNCAESFKRVLDAAWAHANHDQAVMNASHLNVCDGTYSCRSNANDASRKSMHSWAIAVDWAAAWNPNGSTWTGAPSQLPRWFIDCWLAEGWAWGGDFGGTKDPMHFQATKNIHSDAPGLVDVLQYGSTGDRVRELQTALGVPVDGVFGDATDTAVRVFQQAHGLQVDGVVGPATLAALKVQTPAPVPVTPTPLDPIIKEVWQIIVDKSGVRQEVDAAKKQWMGRAQKIADELVALAKDINAFQPTVLGPVVDVTPSLPPSPPPPVLPSPWPSVTPLEDWQSGKASWYSQYPPGWTDPEDKPNSNKLGVGDTYQGVSFPVGDLGAWYEVVSPSGIHSIEQQTDKGPATWTGRGIDISAVAADQRFNYTIKSFPTDSVWKWRRIATPTAVAHLSPKQQAVAYYKLRTSSAQPEKGPIMGGPITTTTGAMSILAAIGALVTSISKGTIDSTALMTLVSAAISGIGLIFAKDHNVTGGTKQQ